MTKMTTMKKIPTEIERKFLIRKPEESALAAMEGCIVSHIRQTYLTSEDGAVERVRRREYPGRTVYTHTIKRRTGKMSALEDETEIDAREYADLLVRAAPGRVPIEKTRCAIPYADHVAEVDLYPFWQNQAVLEIELTDPEDPVPFPPFLQLIREVTGDHAYSNNALAQAVPPEDPKYSK